MRAEGRGSWFTRARQALSLIHIYLVMNLGYSHQVTMSEVEGITIDVPNPNTIIISGPDKQKVGQFAAEVREKRPPEPYKGKGIRYADEYVRRKEGKTGAKKK